MSETKTVKQSGRRLRNLWLNPAYQGRYIAGLVLSGLLLAGLQSAIFYFFTRENYALLVDLSPMSDEAKALLYRELKTIVVLLGAGSFGFILLVGLLGLVYSHRTAGPMFHFKRVFEEINSGNKSARVRLRPNDDFKDVAESFNQMMDKVHSQK